MLHLLFCALIFGLIGGLIGKLLGSGLLGGVFGGGLGGGVIGFYFGFGIGLIDIIFPDYIFSGDRRKSSSIYGLIGGLLGMLIGESFFGGGLIGRLVGGLIGGLTCGGFPVFRPYSFRFILACRNLLPWRLIPFLDHCVDLIFLRRVGGGYIFIHRLLMEHFAEMYVETPTARETKNYGTR